MDGAGKEALPRTLRMMAGANRQVQRRLLTVSTNVNAEAGLDR